MHDETLNKGEDSMLELGPKELQSKYILEATKALAKHYKITEDKALIALGYVMKWTDDYLHVKEVIINLDRLSKKPMTLMTNDEKLAMIAIGYLVRKVKPFKSETNKIGRNDPCPCDSGKKFKQCCLNVAKLNEIERNKNGR
jgi:hypothetical protein